MDVQVMSTCQGDESLLLSVAVISQQTCCLTPFSPTFLPAKRTFSLCPSSLCFSISVKLIKVLFLATFHLRRVDVKLEEMQGTSRTTVGVFVKQQFVSTLHINHLAVIHTVRSTQEP